VAVVPPQVVQTNSVSTSAIASAGNSQTQTVSLSVGSDPAIGPDISQQISSSQLAQAIAQANQVAPKNLSVVSSGVLSGLNQSNSASADSAASTGLNANQPVAVGLGDGALALNPASSLQQISSSQTAIGQAQTVQAHPFNINVISSDQPSSATIGTVSQSNTATSTATASARNIVFQIVSQFQDGTGAQSDLADQGSATSQNSTASASTSQMNVGNINAVVIPPFGDMNPPLSQSNSIGSSAEADASSSTRQTVNQSLSTSVQDVVFDLKASQNGQVIQSGTATSDQAQANRVNIAGWGGTISIPSPTQFSAPVDVQQTQVVQQTQTVIQSSPPGTIWASPPTFPSGGVAPFSFPGVSMFPDNLPFGRPLAIFGGVALYGFGETGVPTQTGATVALMAGPASTPSGPAAPACDQQCEDLYLFGGGAISSARGADSGGSVVALSPSYTFAPPGAGWVQLEQPAPGRPADVSPFERPG
jgi:hypothetical protein